MSDPEASEHGVGFPVAGASGGVDLLDPGVEAGPLGLPETLIAAPTGSTMRRDAWRRFRKNKLAMLGLAVIVLLVIAAVFAPLIARYDPYQLSSDLRKPPSGDHWFGTDTVGRDLFARMVYGARVSLTVGIFAALIATVIGVLFGALAGFYGGFIDAVIMRVTDILLAFPYIVLAIAIITVIGPGQATVILVLGLLGWLAIARVLRSSFLQIKQMEYVEAARAVGASNRRIMFKHMLPNAIQPVIVYSTLFVGSAVLSEAALSFLGIGINEPTPAWGLMVNQGRKFLTSAPHLLLIPGSAIFLMVLAFLFVGDGLRDALDPKLK